MLTSTNMMASELGRKFVVTVNVGWFIIINATFNNISVISWRSVLLMEKTGVPERGFELTTLVEIGTDCI